jgi:ABC-type glycerol-3-phosphate transport system substrate-binding protein
MGAPSFCLWIPRIFANPFLFLIRVTRVIRGSFWDCNNTLSRFPAYCLLFTAYCFLAACANVPPPTNEQPPAPTTNNPIMLTMWHAQPDASTALLNVLANDFHKAYPTLTMRVEPKANEGDILRQGLAAIALNQAPDVVIADNRTLAEFARRGALANLDALLSDAAQGLRDEERADFFPGFLDAGKFSELKNQTFAFPFDQSALSSITTPIY